MPMTELPSFNDIERLHRRFAPSNEAYQLVFDHSKIVGAIAEQLMNLQPFSAAERALVQVGCLLHDIGVYRLYDEAGHLDHANYIRHGILGNNLLREAGFDETLCRFASHHTGVGLTRSDVAEQHLPLPPGDYLAETRAERLVMYADKFHTKTSPPKFLTVDAYADKIGQFGPEKKDKFLILATEFGIPDMAKFNHSHYELT